MSERDPTVRLPVSVNPDGTVRVGHPVPPPSPGDPMAKVRVAVQEPFPPPPTCDRPIIGRDGKPLGFNCNLPAGHESVGGKCAQVDWAVASGPYNA